MNRLGAILAALTLAGPASAAPAAPPDLSGAWQGQQPIVFPAMQARPPPLKPEAMAVFRAEVAKSTAGGGTDYCQTFQFSGFNSGFSSDLDIVTSPGRVTLIADDVSLVRRIYLDQPPPADPPASTSGVSVGHWEGEVLVVETTGLDPTAGFPLYYRPPHLGPGAKIVERIRLLDPETLVFDTEVTAPAILTAPDRRRWTYKRVARPIGHAMSLCSKTDRSIDPSTGRQRFDDTPPKDLPPPPP